MHRPQKLSQRIYLFLIYGLLIFILLICFFIFTYYDYQKNMISEDSKNSINMCSSVREAVTTQLDQMSTISVNIVYSNAIKSNFNEFSTYYQKSGNTPNLLIASREKALAIHDIVTAMIGAFQSASDVKMYTLDGYEIELGYRMSIIYVDVKSFSWYEDTLALKGHKYLTAPVYDNSLPATGYNEKSKKFISLTRSYLDANNEPEGFVEIIQDCNTIFSLASQLQEENKGSRILIYNSRDEQVFPYDSTAKENYASLIQKQNLEEHANHTITGADGKEYSITYQTISDYGWNVVHLKPYSEIIAPIVAYRNRFLLIAASAVCLTLIICYVISKQLTKPLRNLTAATEKITINRVLDEKKINLTTVDSNIKELSILCNAIRDMYEKLRTTTQDALLAKNEEDRAHLQAMQSLINPHFLYNSLTNISIMAEEGMNEDIADMCSALCDYMRYISSTLDMIVDIRTEAFYTEKYLDCMKYRFADDLIFHINIEAESEHVLIPKLIIQPFVENAFKYAFASSGPWILFLHSYIKEGFWYIEIKDNGGTLSDENREHILSSLKSMDARKDLKSLQIGGLGMKSTYMRLKLLYGEKMVFDISSRKYIETVFTIGGPILSKEEYDEKITDL